MKKYEKGDMELAIKELVEYIGKTYPQLPFLLTVETTDQKLWAQSRGGQFQHPNVAIRSMLNSISLINEQMFTGQMQAQQEYERQEILKAAAQLKDIRVRN